MDLIDIYGALHPKAAEYTFFSSAHGTFSRIDHILCVMLGHKASLGKFKKTKIISNISSDHNAIKLETNYKGKNCKKTQHIEAKQYATKQQPMDN